MTGNKGEWSEVYALIKLLADGKLYQSDYNLNKDFNNVYEIVKAFKSEGDYLLEFSIENNIQVIKIKNKESSNIVTFTKEYLHTLTKEALEELLKSKGRSFVINSLLSFIKKTEIQSIKASSKSKADILLRIYDHRLAKESNLGFSIKSLLGGKSTLFNTGKGNNFIFETTGIPEENLESLNKRTYKSEGSSKPSYRINELNKLGIDFKFSSIQSSQLWRNLKMIDGDLPEILALALLYRYKFKQNTVLGVSKLLEENDPLNFYENEEQKVHKFYEYKIKKFLVDSALGMTSEKIWCGEYESFGGVLIVKEDGDLVCFHIYDFNLFRTYLLNNTAFEQAATGEDKFNPGNKDLKAKKKFYYGWFYDEGDKVKIKLNLQIRFT